MWVTKAVQECDSIIPQLFYFIIKLQHVRKVKTIGKTIDITCPPNARIKLKTNNLYCNRHRPNF